MQGKLLGAVTPEAIAEYVQCHCCTGTIRAARELQMDRADDRAGHEIKAPLLALWEARGP